jgi:hypothetical protein
MTFMYFDIILNYLYLFKKKAKVNKKINEFNNLIYNLRPIIKQFSKEKYKY